MISRFICWVFGHKIRVNGFYNSFKYELLKYQMCLRCGKWLSLEETTKEQG